MANNNMRNIWIGALVLSGLILYQAQVLGSGLQDKAHEQELINKRLDIHVNTYEALSERTEGWDKGLLDVEKIGDLLGLYQIVNIEQYAGMQTDLNSFRLTNSNVHIVNGQNIGVVRVCVSSGRRYLNVANEDYQQLISGLDAMAENKAVSFSGVTIEGGNEVAEGQISNLCLLMRSGDAKKGGA